MNKAEKAVSRLFADSIASQDTSGNCNVSTATANEITVQRQVCIKICFDYFLFSNHVIDFNHVSISAKVCSRVW